jgi:hypothetical protein
MGTVTNKHDLPEALVRAVQNDPYKGGGDISTTKLIDAPQIRVLTRIHRDKLSVDVSERIWALLGQGVHTVLERANKGDLVEERLYAEVNGWSVSGQIDTLCLDTNVLSDYKVTTVYKLQDTRGWARQLNVLARLAADNGYQIDRLEIIAILRDWKKGEAERRPEDYPQAPIIRVPIPLWTADQADQYVADRVALHRQADAGEWTPCSDEERWYEGTTYALKKIGGKRALKVADSREALGTVSDAQEIEVRPGSYRRCESYCEVAAFCPQWLDTQRETLAKQVVYAPV